MKLINQLKELFSNKCKFYKNCKYYNSEDDTCNKRGGIYYGMGGYAGCYREKQNRLKNEKIN